MRDLTGRVAVVTGGAGGIGRAMGERFAREGMKVVLADVEEGALVTATEKLRAEGVEATGVVCDVADYASVERLRDAALERYGAVHLLCNNAGIGAGAEGALWEHELNDWRWAFNVNVYGVIHGINAFVPTMISSGAEGHIVNTSSGNGGVSPLRGTPQYAVTKAAVVTLTECLYAQLQDAGSAIGASVLFPGPNMLRTGIFSSWRVRPPELAKERPRQSPYPTIEDIEAQMSAAGIEVNYTEPAEVADQVVRGVQAGDFWISAPSASIDAQIRARADSMLNRTNPTYLREVPG
ncbi:MAG TPA: SDR family NAD(P)-dependent oxidoreductase [Acidimicrobiales bacterium]|jgi:NAD(P)-dependent dehydrogenase (short-subunit alcohol dehydrogenase family)|nr:SDR family NAD(P)-dependent oxidoreductase [Acidimicrobiales bacterium]